MRHVGLAIAAAAALLLAESAASAASKHHARYARHARGPAVQYAPVSKFAPAPPVEGPRAFAPNNACIQDEGYGRWTYCGQGTPGGP
jgi:hypothetical protein